MPDDEISREEFIATIEGEIERYGLLLSKKRRERLEMQVALAGLGQEVDHIRKAMRDARALLATLTGDPVDDEGDRIQPDENARHAALCVLAEAHPAGMAAKDIVAEVQEQWDHTEAAIRSALVRAVGDEDATNPKRGMYRIQTDAKQRFDAYLHPDSEEDSPVTDDDIPF